MINQVSLLKFRWKIFPFPAVLQLHFSLAETLAVRLVAVLNPGTKHQGLFPVFRMLIALRCQPCLMTATTS